LAASSFGVKYLFLCDREFRGILIETEVGMTGDVRAKKTFSVEEMKAIFRWLEGDDRRPLLTSSFLRDSLDTVKSHYSFSASPLASSHEKSCKDDNKNSTPA